MSEVPLIDSEESLRDWLETRPAAEGAAVALRAALRVLPVWLAEPSLHSITGHAVTTLPVLKLLLLVGLLRRTQDKEWADHILGMLGALEHDLDTKRDQRSVSLECLDTLAAAKNVALAALDATASPRAAQATYLSMLATLKSVQRLNQQRGSNGAAAAAEGARTVFWRAVHHDLGNLTQGADLIDQRLWSGQNPLQNVWSSARGKLDAVPGGIFWIDWYQRALDGRSQNWPLLRDVALIDNALWRIGEEALDREIKRLAEGHQQARPYDPKQEIEAALADRTNVATNTVEEIRSAVVRNRAALPSTFDALEGLIVLELERLQQKNDVTKEILHFIRVFLAMHEALTRLRQTVPNEGTPTVEQAVDAEKLITLYRRKLTALPRQKSDEVVHGVWGALVGSVQLGLILGSAQLFTAFGLPALAGVAAGSVVFGGKSAGDILKAAKDMLPKADGAA